MPNHEYPGHEPEPQESFLTSRTGIALVVFLAIAGYFLLSEHRAHALAFLPWLLLIACPLVHLFMHGGHGGHGRSDRSGGDA